MKPEWKFLTDTFFEAAVFWVMVTAVASIALVILGVIPPDSIQENRAGRILEERLLDPGSTIDLVSGELPSHSI